MSLSSEKIYKRKPSIIVRQQLLQVLLRKYIKKVYFGVLNEKRTKQQKQQHQQQTNESKFGDRQLLRQEYYNDIYECLINYCKLNNIASARLTETLDRFTTFTSRREFIESIKKKRTNKTQKTLLTTTVTPTIKATAKNDDGAESNKGEFSRCSMTVTRSSEKTFDENEEIGWGKRVQVELKRELGASFGVCIVGGTVNISNDAQQISGIFIKNIIKSSPAELCKQIKVGDRILAVNDNDVRKATQEQAINLIKNAGCTIKLDIQSFDLSNIPNKTTMNKSVDVSNEKTPYETSIQNNDVQNSTTTKSSEGESSNDDDDSEEEDSLGKVVTKAGKEIDRKSAGNVKRSKEESKADEEPENEFGYTDKKIKKRYGSLGTVIRVKVNRSNNNMGIALAGHRNRNEMGCFIAGLNPKGSASSQNLQVGDEILEINGIVVHKMCHLNASVLIKGIPGTTLEFLVLRKESALDTIAVKAVTTFPAAFDQLDHLHSCYKNVRTVSIQKSGPSLGIMIIEGKHSELGQGIFISDIQDGSNADKAGLLIGEMILAVNKDLLVDCNYDSAASLLKRAEGIVTLIVCNPNKKDDKKDEKKDEPAKTPTSEKKDKPEKPKDDKPADPSKATIQPNKDTVIEINAGGKPLGLDIVGGKMYTPPVNGAYIVNVKPTFAADLDKRLQRLDKITEIEGTKITAEMTEYDLKKLFKRCYLQVKMTVYRNEPSSTEVTIEIGNRKGFGFNYKHCPGHGIMVTDITPGSSAALDGRLTPGDMITCINGENIQAESLTDTIILIKTSQSKLTLKVSRPAQK
ncbi:inactivation-no-after-potential D protein isoform X2 [Contarinia nasturtii]|uniref:inactivation-no-after-potential D protein isoform X2 n=1 Tax=Contarinia nasturtii TaxID=265458 RepID=UPI0012D3EEF7|nr:inactivation-no-after-potential D protein isoform X2 [Contarinia nasturtii]